MDYLPILIYLFIVTLSFSLLNPLMDIGQLLFANRTQAQASAFVYLLIGLNIVFLLMIRAHQTLYDLLVGTYGVKKAP